jgi:biopolymer transport protein ExbD
MRRRPSSLQDAEEASPNLTPLIDVVFVVLIMFIIIAPMLEIDKVKLASGPEKGLGKNTSVQEASRIVIHVHEDNTIWLNLKKVPREDLVNLLKIAKRQNPTAIPQLFQDKKAHFGVYQSVKNAVELSGFDELDVVLEPG